MYKYREMKSDHNDDDREGDERIMDRGVDRVRHVTANVKKENKQGEEKENEHQKQYSNDNKQFKVQ